MKLGGATYPPLCGLLSAETGTDVYCACSRSLVRYNLKAQRSDKVGHMQWNATSMAHGYVLPCRDPNPSLRLCPPS